METLIPSRTDWRGSAAALGLLVFRLHLGVVMVEAGLPKLETSDWFTQQVADLGFTFPSPVLWAWVAAWGELVGGIMLVLGLGTRWAAAQLAFQFFVISFMWYSKPEFFTGMYVQQEMFWGFVLLTATGAGRWSADAWLRGRAWNLWPRRVRNRKAVAAAAVVLGLLVLAVPAAAGCASDRLYSDLTIAPGKQFLLGGGQPGAFKVAAKNKGKVAVEIKEQLAGGAFRTKATLNPGQSGVIRFAAGSAAVLLNPSPDPARLDLTVTGDNGNLRMQSETLPASSQAKEVPRLSVGELSDLLALWQGTLQYVDYRTTSTVTLNTAVQGEMTRPGQLLLRFDYEEPSKKHVTGVDTLVLAADGSRVRWDGIDFAVRAKEWLPGQTLRLVLEGQGQDDNRTATIRKTLVLGPKQFSLKKEVRYAANTPFVPRNQYRFSR